MLKKFFEFLSNLFGNLFGSKQKKVVKQQTPPRIQETEDLPQDGSEILPDTTIIIYNEHDSMPDNNSPTSGNATSGDSGGQTNTQHTTETESIPPREHGETTTSTAGAEATTEVEAGTENAGQAPSTTSQQTETPTATNHKPRYLWCLDNGHGKKTAGKRSPELDSGERFYEYEFNRDIVRRIIDKLEPAGVKFFNVVPEIDVDNFLEERVRRANHKRSDIPKIFLSIHSNAAPALPGKWASQNIHGIETWFFHGSRKGRILSGIFQKHLVEATGWNSRNIKSQPEKQFFVLRKTNMTAVLTENGFYNNKNQCIELLKGEIRQKIADAHVAAILEIEKSDILGL